MKERNTSGLRLGVALGLVIGFLVMGAVLVIRAASPPVTLDPPRPRAQLDVAIPGVVRPSAREPDEVVLPDESMVIGVMVEGRARAYPVTALSTPGTHVVNDVFGGRAVSVTYCDVQNCTRVFTADDDDPLDIGVAGYDRGLVLLVRGFRYRQDTAQPIGSDGPFPYDRMEYVRTTWKAWRDAHPETDVVVVGG